MFGPGVELLEVERPLCAVVRKANERAKVFVDMASARYFNFCATRMNIRRKHTPTPIPFSRAFPVVGSKTGRGAPVGEVHTLAVPGSLQVHQP